VAISAEMPLDVNSNSATAWTFSGKVNARAVRLKNTATTAEIRGISERVTYRVYELAYEGRHFDLVD
jgi:hypothetical protein